MTRIRHRFVVLLSECLQYWILFAARARRHLPSTYALLRLEIKLVAHKSSRGDAESVSFRHNVCTFDSTGSSYVTFTADASVEALVNFASIRPLIEAIGCVLFVEPDPDPPWQGLTTTAPSLFRAAAVRDHSGIVKNLPDLLMGAHCYTNQSRLSECHAGCRGKHRQAY